MYRKSSFPSWSSVHPRAALCHGRHTRCSRNTWATTPPPKKKKKKNTRPKIVKTCRGVGLGRSFFCQVDLALSVKAQASQIHTHPPTRTIQTRAGGRLDQFTVLERVSLRSRSDIVTNRNTLQRAVRPISGIAGQLAQGTNFPVTSTHPSTYQPKQPPDH